MTQKDVVQRVSTLSPQQHRAMTLVCEGRTWEEVAEELGVGYGSMKTVRNRIYHKLGLTGLPRPAIRAAYIYGRWLAGRA